MRSGSLKQCGQVSSGSPGSQIMHERKSAADFLPCGQVLQANAPLLSWYSPTSHWMHSEFPRSGWYFPARHEMHSELPVLDWYCPRAQSLHELSPAPPAILPLGQSLHSGNGWSAALPWASVHAVDWPGAQSTHTTLRGSGDVPCAQGMQSERSTSSWYIPTSHWMHDILGSGASAGWYFPISHWMHSELPVPG